MARQAKPKLVVVTWVDSTTWDRWEYGPVEKHDLHLIDSVGWILRSDKDAIVLAPNLSRGEGQGRCCVMTIPAGCVKRVRRIAT